MTKFSTRDRHRIIRLAVSNGVIVKQFRGRGNKLTWIDLRPGDHRIRNYRRKDAHVFRHCRRHLLPH